MLALEIQIKRFALTARAHARLMREINYRVMERQWKRVPQHFDERGYTLYRFRKRGTKYDRYKKNKFGHTRPNYRTGTLFKRLSHKITATQHGGRLLMRSFMVRKPPEEWAKMTFEQQARFKRSQRRLAGWQKREIAIMSKGEITQERKQSAREYRKGALSPQYARQRARRIK